MQPEHMESPVNWIVVVRATPPFPAPSVPHEEGGPSWWHNRDRVSAHQQRGTGGNRFQGGMQKEMQRF